MKCNQAKDLLRRFPEDALSPEVRSDLNAHLQQCAICRDWHESLNESWAVLDQFEALDVPADFTAKVMQRVGQSPGSKAACETGSRGWWNGRFVAAVAAALLVVVGLWAAFGRNSAPPNKAQRPQPKQERDIAKAPQQKPETEPQKQKTGPDLKSLPLHPDPIQKEPENTPNPVPDVVPDETQPNRVPDPSDRPRIIVQDLPKSRTIPIPPRKVPEQPRDVVAKTDERLIRDLEVYENMDLLKNLELLVDFDTVEKLDQSVL